MNLSSLEYFFLYSSVKSLKTVTLQYVLRIAHLFFISVLQKRLFATIHFLTKYSDSSMKSVSHIVEPPTQLHLNVNEKLCLMLLNMLTSPRSPSPAEPLCSCICARNSVENKLDSVDFGQIKTTKASDDYDDLNILICA